MSQPTTDSVPDSWSIHVATAVVTGVVTTYLPVQRWSRPARWALHGGLGVLSAGAVAVGLTRPDLRAEPTQEEAPVPRLAPAKVAGLAIALGAAAAGASRGGQALDTWVERRLGARGVRRPRRWMGVAVAGASLAMSIAESRQADSRRTDEEPSPPPHRP